LGFSSFFSSRFQDFKISRIPSGGTEHQGLHPVIVKGSGLGEINQIEFVALKKWSPFEVSGAI
jgi:hypothetical protein